MKNKYIGAIACFVFALIAAALCGWACDHHSTMVLFPAFLGTIAGVMGTIGLISSGVSDDY